MATIIYSVETRKPGKQQPVTSKGTVTYAHDPATGKVEGTKG